MEVQETVAYSQIASILQFQMANDKIPSEMGAHSLYILSNDNSFIELQCNSGLDTPIENQSFDIIRKV